MLIHMLKLGHLADLHTHGMKLANLVAVLLQPPREGTLGMRASVGIKPVNTEAGASTGDRPEVRPAHRLTPGH